MKRQDGQHRQRRQQQEQVQTGLRLQPETLGSEMSVEIAEQQKNLEEEVYDNYKPVSGIMAPYSITRLFNGDMSNQRFLNSVTINQGLDPTMFDPNSGYNPNKAGKSGKR